MQLINWIQHYQPIVPFSWYHWII